jgi:hypothetical protein
VVHWHHGLLHQLLEFYSKNFVIFFLVIYQNYDKFLHFCAQNKCACRYLKIYYVEPLSFNPGVRQQTLKYTIESLILAQDERWRRA